MNGIKVNFYTKTEKVPINLIYRGHRTSRFPVDKKQPPIIFIAGQSPSKHLVREIRECLRLTAEDASKVIYVNKRSWINYEAGARTMSPASWELFCLKTGLASLIKPKKTKQKDLKIGDLASKVSIDDDTTEN